MVENNRKPIASLNMFPQFTTMNVIDGQAGIIIYSSLICYSLTIDNILNIIVLLILAGVTVATLTGDNGLLTKAGEAKTTNSEAEGLERIQLAVMASRDDRGINTAFLAKNLSEINGLTDNTDQVISESTEIRIPKVIKLNSIQYIIYQDGNVEKIIEGLPSRYKKVEYIESTGTQWIDTEYLLKSTTKIDTKFMINAPQQKNAVFGAKTEEVFYMLGQGTMQNTKLQWYYNKGVKNLETPIENKM